MNVWPAIVSVPIRSAVLFGATPNATVPLPLPVAPEVTVIHGALLVAVHAHPLPLVAAGIDSKEHIGLCATRASSSA